MVVEIIIFVLSVAALAWSIWFKKTACVRTRTLIYKNNKHPDSLSTTNGVGTMMFGNFKYENGTKPISYRFIVLFFLPIFPLECYLCKKCDGYYIFNGWQDWQSAEVLCCYLYPWSILLICISSLMILTSL